MRPVQFLRFALSLFAVVLLRSGIHAGETPQDPRFHIDARVHAAMEGGPFIIEVTYTYQGRKPIDIIIPGLLPIIHVAEKVPGHWENSGRSYLQVGPSEFREKLTPGKKWSEILYLHQCYSNITPGCARIELTWTIRTRESKGKPIARTSTILKVNVSPADAKHLAALRSRLQKKVAKRNLSEGERDFLVNHLLRTHHPELIPVAWQMLEAGQRAYPTYALAVFIYDCTPSPEQVHARLVPMALDSSRDDAEDIFACWEALPIGWRLREGSRFKRSLPPRLPLPEIRRLKRAHSVWTRILTYVTFPKACDKPWTTALLRDVRDLLSPLPRARFAELVRDLDDDAFLVREKATATLIQLGHRVEGQLRVLQRQRLSPEVKRRVQQILEAIPNAKPSPSCAAAMEYIANRGSPEAISVLRILAEGPPTAWLTKEAKEGLARCAIRPVP